MRFHPPLRRTRLWPQEGCEFSYQQLTHQCDPAKPPLLLLATDPSANATGGVTHRDARRLLEGAGGDIDEAMISLRDSIADAASTMEQPLLEQAKAAGVPAAAISSSHQLLSRRRGNTTRTAAISDNLYMQALRVLIRKALEADQPVGLTRQESAGVRPSETDFECMICLTEFE